MIKPAKKVTIKDISRILRIARELNYTPNPLARSLVKRQSKSVALMITSPRNPIFPEIATGIEEVLREHDCLGTHHFLGLPTRKRPSAIPSCNDDMAVVGFNNVEATSMRAIDLATIDQHAHAMGRIAAQRLIDKLEGEVRGGVFRKVLEPRLVIRGSCGYSRSGYEWPVSRKSLSLKGKEGRDVSRKDN